ncbi:MAG: hypothetical protein DSZ05_07465 [Sulfurospirillum sp.]|nr:MAG: hypothetical protein DSZ05_07465 [Sulfurospirillum sp.]
MKKRTVQFLGLIEVLLLLGALMIFVLQNPNTLTFFLNYATKELDLSYGSVEGNLLRNIKVKDITYQGEKLTQEAVIDWNIKALLTASLKIDEISIKKLNIPVTEKWIEALHKKFHKKGNKKKITYIPTIEVSSIFFSALPFTHEKIKINRIELFAKNIKGNLKHIDVGFFSFLTESNYADITALGKLENNILSFEKLWLESLDIAKIRTFVKTLSTTQHKSTKTPSIPAYRNFIEEIRAENLIAYIKPMHTGHYQINQSSVAMRHLTTTDMKLFNAKEVFIHTATNMWELSSKGSLKNNRLFTKVRLTLVDKYFKRFVPFFNHNAIAPVMIDLTVDKDGLSGDLTTHTTPLLIKKYRDINASIPKLKAHVDFDFHKLDMRGDIDATIKTKYTPQALLNGHIYYNRVRHFFYDGNLSIPETRALPQQLLMLLQKNHISFKGNTKKIKATLKNDYLTARYDGPDYIHTHLQVRSVELPLTKFFTKLPQALHEAKAAVTGDIPIHFKKLMPLKPLFSIKSNLFDINGTAVISKKLETKLILTKSKNSLISDLFPGLRQNRIFPLRADFAYQDKQAVLKLQNRITKLNIHQNFATSQTDAALIQGVHRLQLKGDIHRDCNLTFQTPSLREFQNFLYQFYRFDKLPADGDIHLNVTLHELQKADAVLKGKWFVYEYKANRFLFAEKIRISAFYGDKTLRLKRYFFSTYLDRDRLFFANKPSVAHFHEKNIVVQNFYINDFAYLRGKYNYANKHGAFRLTTKNYHYNDIEGNFYFDADLGIKLSPQKSKIEGKCTLNRGTITYAPHKKHYVQDKDIIIIQNQRVIVKEEDRLALDISVISKDPIYYKVPNTNVKLKIDLKIWKEVNRDLELLGMIKILSGTHMQSGKEFELEPGEILFSGSPLNPYLNIRAIHRSDPYTIYINITGQLDAPLINFSATPYLSQSDILSLLLFNSTTDELMSGNQDTSKTAMTMFGSLFAKEIVRNFGIKLDKLVLTTTEEGKLGIELGKKLSKKVTLIYINDIVQTIKIRYKMSDHFETDFILSPDNSGVDIIYKDEY